MATLELPRVGEVNEVSTVEINSDQSQEPMRIEGEIPVSLPIENGSSYLFISHDQRALTHGIHKFPAKFFPELPRWIIKRYSREGDLVLDPFMGSGTTNLEASILGRHSIGVDVDPLARTLASVKTTVLNEDLLVNTWQKLRQCVEAYVEPSHVDGVPEFPYRDNWFQLFILKELAHIKIEIENTCTDEHTKNFFRICFSSVIRQVSEADNNCTRTVIRRSLNKQVHPKMAVDLFLKRTEVQVRNMLQLSLLKPSGNVFIPDNVDARDMPVIKNGSIDLALTSPPYVNAVDYPRTHQLELYWLGFANGSLQPLKKKHIGTEVVRAREYADLHSSGCDEADQAISKIYESDPRRAFIATKYLWDMVSNLKEVYRVLKRGAVYVIVVGNNRIRGVEFETWRYLCVEASKVGFSIECCFISTIINHFIKVPRKERINDDYVLVLRK